MNILSIQSEVVYGHVGQGAARFALQRLGHEVWAIPTVIYSNHAAYPDVQGDTVPADLLLRLLDGLATNGWLTQCDAVLSGYLGSAEQAPAVAEAVLRAKGANPRSLYCLDPVFGDNGRAYAKPGVAEAVARHLLPLADIVTPNAFELQHLSALPVNSPREAITAAERLGRPLVLVTSVPRGTDRIGALATSGNESWYASTSLLKETPHGAGDLLAALFLAEQLNGSTVENALKGSIARVFQILTASRGFGELRLIPAQPFLAEPPECGDIQCERLA